MIDERINKSLTELENQLKSVESARKQVEKTIKSFDGLYNITSDYVNSLNSIKIKLDEVVNLIRTDYTKKISEFEEDRNSIVKACNDVIAKMDSKTESIENQVASTIKSLQCKLKYSLILNVITTLGIIALTFMLLRLYL